LKNFGLIFEIVINLIAFLKIKINIIDVTEIFFDEFPPFCKHKKGHQH